MMGQLGTGHIVVIDGVHESLSNLLIVNRSSIPPGKQTINGPAR